MCYNIFSSEKNSLVHPKGDAVNFVVYTTKTLNITGVSNYLLFFLENSSI